MQKGPGWVPFFVAVKAMARQLCEEAVPETPRRLVCSLAAGMPYHSSNESVVASATKTVGAGGPAIRVHPAMQAGGSPFGSESPGPLRSPSQAEPARHEERVQRNLCSEQPSAAKRAAGPSFAKGPYLTHRGAWFEAWQQPKTTKPRRGGVLGLQRGLRWRRGCAAGRGPASRLLRAMTLGYR